MRRRTSLKFFSNSVILLLSSACVAGQAPTSTNAVGRFLNAVQKRDLRTVVSLMEQYRAQADQIKASNPQVLWGKLIGEFYDQKVAELSPQSGVWTDFGDLLGGGAGKAIRASATYLPPSARWKISEMRRMMRHYPLGNALVTIAYVTIDYPGLEGSPEVDGKFLKHTILEITADSTGSLVSNLARVAAGDIFWTKPYPPQATPFLAKRYKEALIAAVDERAAAAAVRELVDLAWDAVEPALLEAAGSRSAFAYASFLPLAEHHSSKAVPLLVALIGDSSSALASACAPAPRAAAAAIGVMGRSQGAEATAPALRQALTAVVNFSLDPPDAVQRLYFSECIADYLASLSVVDDDTWRSFSYSYSKPFRLSGGKLYGAIAGGGSAFWKLLSDVIDRNASVSTIDASSPTVENVKQFFRTVDLCANTYGSTCPMNFGVERILINSRNETDLFGYYDRWNGKIGYDTKYDRAASFKMTLKAVSSLVQPSGWQIQDIALTPVNAPSGTPPSAAEPTRTDSTGKVPAASRPAGSLPAICSEVNSCLAQATGALERFNVDVAILYWDAALALGGTIAIPACHQRGMRRCETGTISLGAKEVSFTNSDGQKVLSVPPSQVTPIFSARDVEITHGSFNIQVGKKNDNYAFVPFGNSCQMLNYVVCPPGGIAQQSAVANYVVQAISILADQAQRQGR